MQVFCDNEECLYIDEYGFCDCSKLQIEGGICCGSIHGGGRTESETERLQDENEQLRMQLDNVIESCKRLEKRNAKLRDLVRDMWHDMPKSESCGWDSKHNHCAGYDSCNGECSYWYRMNGLGIEVDE